MTKFEFTDMLTSIISEYLNINVQPCDATPEIEVRLPNGEIFVVEVRKVR